MDNITIRQKLNIFAIGFISSLLILLMFYVLFAQVISDFVIGQLEGMSILFIIMMSLLLLTLFSSVIISFFMVKDIKRVSIAKASVMSLIVTLFVIIILSYVSLFILYPDIFRELENIGIILVFPQVILYFGVYVLNEIYALFILTLVIYFIVYIMFLEVFYEHEPKKYVSKKNYKW